MQRYCWNICYRRIRGHQVLFSLLFTSLALGYTYIEEEEKCKGEEDDRYSYHLIHLLFIQVEILSWR